jgi:hypothetical protein
MLGRFAVVVSLFLALTNAAATRVPVDVSNHRILIPVSVNGGIPGTFVLDTGASITPLDKDFAAQQAVLATSRTKTNGAGGAPLDVGLAKKLTFTFAGLTVQTPESPLIPLGPVSLRAGRPLHGVLGFDVLSRYVTELDYASSVVTFHARNSFRAAAEATSIPMRLHGRMPLVEVKLALPDGRLLNARLLIDTGAAGAVTLTRAFAREHRVTLTNAVETLMGGVGGEAPATIGRLARLQLGPFRFEEPVATVATDTAGALADPKIDGIIGGEILRRFTIAIDYGSKQLFFTPNSKIDEPFHTDMTGMALASADATFTTVIVRNLVAGSAAAEAGILVGDELRAVDGQRVVPSDFSRLRESFRVPDRRLELTIVRDGVERNVVIVTRRIV